ncbi:hypothetical protein Tco_1307153 [Tanacetum coccineum]
MKDRCSEKQVLGYVLIVDSCNEEPCRDVHQVGDEREVEVLRNFNWPPSELITEDGVLPERGGTERIPRIESLPALRLVGAASSVCFAVQKFASQVDEKNDLSKTVTPHYLPKVREYAVAKPHQVNSRAKVQSPKIRNNNPVEPKNHTHKPGRQNGTSTQVASTSFKSFKGKTRSLVTKKTDISYVRSSRNSNLMNIHQMTLDHSSSSLGPHCLMMSVHISSGLVLHLDVVWTKQFKPRSSSKDVWINRFKPRKKKLCKADLEGPTFNLVKAFHKNNVFLQYQMDECHKLLTNKRSLLHDNIVPKPDLALELGKSISLTEAEEEAVAREVHATHARIVSESEPEPTQRRQFGIAFRDSFIVSKKRSSDSSKKLKGIQTLTPAKQEAAHIMKALKESKKMSKRHNIQLLPQLDGRSLT